MAWIRWRGDTAQLMATVWEDGHSHQQYLGSLGAEYTVPSHRRDHITARFPTVLIDWDAINQAVATGPRGTPPLNPTALTWATVEWQLEAWSETGPALDRMERQALHLAALVLRNWRARGD